MVEEENSLQVAPEHPPGLAMVVSTHLSFPLAWGRMTQKQHTPVGQQEVKKMEEAGLLTCPSHCPHKDGPTGAWRNGGEIT